MSWKLGAGLGFLRGGPLGALIGGTLQHFVTKKYFKKQAPSLPGLVHRGLFVSCLAAVLTKVMMARGPLAPEEVRVVHGFLVKHFQFGEEGLRFIDQVIRETQKVDPDIKSLVEQYQKAAGHQYGRLLVALCYRLALVGDSLTEPVEKRINEVARRVSVSYREQDQIRSKYALPPMKSPYTVLGLDYDAGDEEIKRAYRRLAGQYHPDRAAHQGEDFSREAHLKFLEIREAYEELEDYRDL